MADAVIGSGYLQVVPKLDKGVLDSELSKAGESGSSNFTKSFQGGVSAKSVAIGNVMSAAVLKGVEKASQAVTKVITGSFANYSTYEQLSGGVRKIFDDMDNSRVFADAGDAWRDLNMSANDYMATINDVGAMFSATMGDDAAYDTARKGMKAISDYSSGTGKNLDVLNQKFAMITRATSSYQSIADQFSGILPATSKDFLEQAQAAGYLSGEYEKLTEVPISEYQTALVSMLEDGTEALGLHGNTAEETAETISGSIAGMEAAWSNWLTGIADENADMDKLTDDLVESVGNAVDNVVPRIQEILGRIGPAARDAIGGVLRDVSPELGDSFDKAAEGAGKLAEGFGHIVDQAAASGVLEDVATAIYNIGDTIANADFGPVFEALGNILGKLNDFGTFMKDWEADSVMENGGMFAELTDPSTWHMFDEATKTFRTDLEKLGGSVSEYGKLSDSTMRQVADSYRTNGHDMEAALASAGLSVDRASGKLVALDEVEIGDKTYRVDDDGTIYDQTGKIVGLNGELSTVKDKRITVTDNGTASRSSKDVSTLESSISKVKAKAVDVKANVSGLSDVTDLASYISNLKSKTIDVVTNVFKVTKSKDAAGGFFELHAAGGFITSGPTVLGTDRYGSVHIAGEDGREWVQRHADGTTSILPIQNRKYLEPYAQTIASMIGAGGRSMVVNVNLQYDSSAEARQMAQDVADRLHEILRMGG